MLYLMWRQGPLLKSTGAVIVVLAIAACGGEAAVRSGSTTAVRASANTTSVLTPRAQAEASQACHAWATAGTAPGSTALTTHAAQAAAAQEGTRAAAANSMWTRLAKAMTGSVDLPAAMLTPAQESQANADLGTIRILCARLGIAVAT